MQLAYDTLDIRESNLDDVQYHRAAAEGRRLEYLQAWGPSQGRPTAYVSSVPFWTLDAITVPWLYQAFRLGAVALALGLLGRLAAEVTGSRELTPLWMLIWIAVLQIPPTFYGLLSYPAFHWGVIFTTVALLDFWRAISREPAPAISWTAGFWYFLGLQFTEALLSFLLAFVLLFWWRFPLAQWRSKWRALIPIFTACGAFLVLYAIYRHINPPTYEGTKAGGSMVAALLYLVRYSASSLPGFELLADRNTDHPLFVSARELINRAATLDFWRIPWILITGGAVAWWLYRAEWLLSLRRSAALALGVLIVGLAFLGMPGVSEKYQGYAYRRFYPHVYNFTFVNLLWLAFAIASLVLIARFQPGGVQRKLVAAAFGGLVAAACLASQISNPLALEQIRQIISTAP